MTSFADVIKLCLVKYVIKMTSQNFSIFKSSPLSKILVVPLTMMLTCRVNSDVTHSCRLQANLPSECSGLAKVSCALGQEIFLRPPSTNVTEFEVKNRCKSAEKQKQRKRI